MLVKLNDVIEEYQSRLMHQYRVLAPSKTPQLTCSRSFSFSAVSATLRRLCSMRFSFSSQREKPPPSALNATSTASGTSMRRRNSTAAYLCE